MMGEDLRGDLVHTTLKTIVELALSTTACEDLGLDHSTIRT